MEMWAEIAEFLHTRLVIIVKISLMYIGKHRLTPCSAACAAAAYTYTAVWVHERTNGFITAYIRSLVVAKVPGMCFTCSGLRSKKGSRSGARVDVGGALAVHAPRALSSAVMGHDPGFSTPSSDKARRPRACGRSLLPNTHGTARGDALGQPGVFA